MERECNKCVYSTRDGDCRKFTCEGTKTVEDIKAEARQSAIEEFAELLIKRCWSKIYGDLEYVSEEEIKEVAEQLKENNND